MKIFLTIILTSDRSDYDSPVVAIFGSPPEAGNISPVAEFCNRRWNDEWGVRPESTTELVEAYFTHSSEWPENFVLDI